ncbi:hypothetical protein ABK040_007249 [Willaertia magna]
MPSIQNNAKQSSSLESDEWKNVTINDKTYIWPKQHMPFRHLLDAVEHWSKEKPNDLFLKRIYTKGEVFSAAHDENERIQEITYSQFRNTIWNLRKVLLDRFKDCPKGTVFSILSENSFEFVMLIFSLWLCGFIPFVVNIRLSPQILSELLPLSSAKRHFISKPLLQKFQSSMKGNEEVNNIFDKLFTNNEFIVIGNETLAQKEDKEFSNLNVYDRSYSEQTSDFKVNILDEIDLEAPCFYLHTSGSTNIPKVVIHGHRSFISYLHYAFNFRSKEFPKVESKYALTWLPIYHMMGLANCFNCLYSGITFVICNMNPHESISQTFAYVIESVKEDLKYTVVNALTFLLDEIKHNYELDKKSTEPVLENLSKCIAIACGGVSTPHDIVHFFQSHHINLQNGYGMSENCLVFSSERFSGGFMFLLPVLPLDYYVWKLAESASGTELCLREDCPVLALNYISKDPKVKFINEGVFRTRDVFVEFPRGHYNYVARADEILSHSTGELTNPVPIETSLRESNPALHQVMLVGAERPYCVGIFELVEDIEKSDEIIENLKDTIAKLNQTLPSHSRVSQNLIVLERGERLPLTSKGAISRRHAERFLKERIEQAYLEVVGDLSSVTEQQEETIVFSLDPIKEDDFLSFLQNVFQEATPLDTSLTQRGMDSLVLIQLRNKLNFDYGAKITVDEIFRADTPRNLLHLINQRRNRVIVKEPRSPKPMKTVPKSFIAPQQKEIKEKEESPIDVEIRKDIELLTQKVSDIICHSKDNLKHETVFVTGVSGFLGAYLLNELLTDYDNVPSSKKVYCLIRGNSIDHAKQRLIDNLKKYELFNDRMQNIFSERVEVILGDVGHENHMGMDESIYQTLVNTVDVIYHNAAHVDFVQPYSSLRKSNVLGTLQIIEMALTHHIKPIAFTSSISVATNDEDSESVYLDKIPPTLTFGYPQTKYVSERLLMETKKRFGLPTLIYRPGLIVGDLISGKMPIGFLAERVLQSIKHLKKSPQGLYTMVGDLINVDFVSKVIVDSMRFKLFDQQVIHIQNSQPVQRDDEIVQFLQKEFNHLFGNNIQQVPLEEWLNQIEQHDHSSDGMYPLVHWTRENFLDKPKNQKVMAKPQHHLKTVLNVAKEKNVAMKEIGVFDLMKKLVQVYVDKVPQ